jgi:hypothetical protein
VRQGVKKQKHKEALKMIFSAVFLVSGLTFGKKYLDHKDFSLNVKKNPAFYPLPESSFWRVATLGRHYYGAALAVNPGSFFVACSFKF